MNCLFLFIGAVLANVIGTTGASMLLIRPWMRMNKYRILVAGMKWFLGTYTSRFNRVERCNRRAGSKNTPAKLKGLSASAGRGQCGWSGRHPMNGIAWSAILRRMIE